MKRPAASFLFFPLVCCLFVNENIPCESNSHLDTAQCGQPLARGATCIPPSRRCTQEARDSLVQRA